MGWVPSVSCCFFSKQKTAYSCGLCHHLLTSKFPHTQSLSSQHALWPSQSMTVKWPLLRLLLCSTHLWISPFPLGSRHPLTLETLWTWHLQDSKQTLQTRMGKCFMFIQIFLSFLKWSDLETMCGLHSRQCACMHVILSIIGVWMRVWIKVQDCYHTQILYSVTMAHLCSNTFICMNACIYHFEDWKMRVCIKFYKSTNLFLTCFLPTDLTSRLWLQFHHQTADPFPQTIKAADSFPRYLRTRQQISQAKTRDAMRQGWMEICKWHYFMQHSIIYLRKDAPSPMTSAYAWVYHILTVLTHLQGLPPWGSSLQ